MQCRGRRSSGGNEPVVRPACSWTPRRGGEGTTATTVISFTRRSWRNRRLTSPRRERKEGEGIWWSGGGRGNPSRGTDAKGFYRARGERGTRRGAMCGELRLVEGAM